ncbi:MULTISPECIES: glycosyl hydrolase [Klebsiella]|nr:glycosyl hydrolase [Klebsiella aerogenes]MEB6076161.1 glycoside hydrolase family protein [Klebsiella aerogenes]CAF9405337.1 hypothetical protein AI2913V1_1546 [Klebsiella aerogenes]CAH5863820.1 hypothetical protein AI2913V1_1546 [Klebsiella aerogenes]HCD5426595.1 hypothetical protein [Klebsiella aerogenes]HCR0138827.1 hypothetical protein [Klebsiella aerogenes]
MRRKTIFLWCLLSFICAVNSSKAFAYSEKKGLGVIPGNSLNKGYTTGFKKLNVQWYYNWGIYPERGMPHGILYVPMLGNKKTLKNINAVTSYPYVLLFNEPDVSGALTKSISPEEAASLFKNVMNKLQNIKVISPAPQNPWNNWLTNFNSMSFNSKPMNAVAMHWYGLPDINKFKRDVLYIHNKYKSNLWITEFGIRIPCSDNSLENQRKVSDFLRNALEFLNSQQYVEKYSWFSPKNNTSESCDLRYDVLINSDGTLTDLGLLYSKY